MKRIIACVCLMIVLLGLAGCNENATDIGTTCANITMGSGSFAYSNGSIYYSNSLYLYQYDTQNGKSAAQKLDGSYTPGMLFVYKDHLYSGIKRIAEDGTVEGSLFDREGSCSTFFLDGRDGFFLDNGALYHRNMKTGKENRLTENVLSYYVDDESIYVVVKSADTTYLYKSARKKMQFERIELSFAPAAAYACREGIFLSTYKTKQLVWYVDGVETELPIKSTCYQVCESSLIYTDEEWNGDAFPVNRYDLETGEETLLYESVENFCVLENKYACFECNINRKPVFYLMDLQTGKTTEMPAEVN